MKNIIVFIFVCLTLTGCTTLDQNTVMTLNNRLTAIEDKIDEFQKDGNLRSRKPIPKNNDGTLEIEVPVKIKVLMDVETKTNEVKNDGK